MEITLIIVFVIIVLQYVATFHYYFKVKRIYKLRGVRFNFKFYTTIIPLYNFIYWAVFADYFITKLELEKELNNQTK